MIVLLCSYCTFTIDSFDEMAFDETGSAFHSTCPQIADYVGDIEDEFGD